MLSDPLSNWYVAFAIFLLGFGFLVFIHELGHFLVAKMVGIRCSQFAVCFGNAVLSWRKGIGLRVGSTEAEYRKQAIELLKKQGKYKGDETDDKAIMLAADELGLGETEYRLNSIPLGGYVKMVGQEDLDPNARSDDPRAYNNKSVGARLAVISAGVVMNVITGFVFFIIAFMIGVEFPAAMVGSTDPGSPAATTYAKGHEGDSNYLGLKPGDDIIAINDEEVRDGLDERMATALASIGSTLDFKVKRAGYGEPLVFPIKPEYEGARGLMFSGINPMPTLILGPTDQSPQLAEAGVHEKMVISSVDGQPVSDYVQFIELFTQNPTQPKAVTFSPGEKQQGQDITVTLLPPPTLTVSASSDKTLVSNLLGLVPAITVGSVSPKSPAAAAGIQVGDVIRKIGTVTWPTFAGLRDQVVKAGDEGVSVHVIRDGETVDLGKLVPRDGVIGIAMKTGESYIAQVMPDSAMSGLNLTPGTHITAIDGTPVTSWSDMQAALQSKLKQMPKDAATTGIELTYQLNIVDQPGETATVAVTAAQALPILDATWTRPIGMQLRTLMTDLKASGPIEATMLGIDKTHQFMVQTYMTLLRLFQGSVAAKNLNGPVGIVQHGTTFTTRGVGYLLFFLGLISINLAVLNFLPIPIVDGGHAVFLLYEKIVGQPPGERFQTASMLLGLVVLGGVFLFVTYHDIVRLVS